MSRLHLLAPAKINLMLRIVGKRADGYHNLQTLFQFIDLCDDITLSTLSSSDIRLSSNFKAVSHHENIVVKAAKALQTYSHCGKGADIKLVKKIPHGAGLGGGSSDAATVLLGLNHLWQLNLSREQLLDIGLKLGADVPVFILGHAAWAEGIGEQLTPVNPSEPYYVLLKPQTEINTGLLFSHQDLTRDQSAIKIPASFEGINDNVFEPLVRSLYPEVDRCFELLSGFGQPQLTGTGSCVFVRADDLEQAKHIANTTENLFATYIVRGYNRSPLATRHNYLYISP